jgi:hypothetical protein
MDPPRAYFLDEQDAVARLLLQKVSVGDNECTCKKGCIDMKLYALEAGAIVKKVCYCSCHPVGIWRAHFLDNK